MRDYVDYELVWRTIQERLPAVKARLQTILRQETQTREQ